MKSGCHPQPWQRGRVRCVTSSERCFSALFLDVCLAALCVLRPSTGLRVNASAVEEGFEGGLDFVQAVTDTGVLDTGGTKGIVDPKNSGWPRASSGFLVRQHLDGKTMMPVRSRDALCLNGERRWRIFAGDFGGLPRPRVLRVAAVLRLV